MKTAAVLTLALATATQATPILNLGKENGKKDGLLDSLLDLNLDLGLDLNLDLEEGGKKGGLDLDLDIDLDLDLELGLCGKKTKYFTSAYKVIATPNQVVNSMNQKTGGLKGAKGLYKFGINSEEDVICFKIILTGFVGEYESPANTATHIHQAGKGMSGPPRIVFPNPEGDKIRISKGCLKGPFTTGVPINGLDSGVGFTLRQIEANPKNFNADVHSSKAVPGALFMTPNMAVA